MTRIASLFGAAALACLTAAPTQAGPGDLPIIAAAIDSGRLVQARLMLARQDAGDDPDELAYLQGRLALAEGNDAAALRRFEPLAAAHPGNCRFVGGAGLAAARLAQTDRAIAWLIAATDACPDDWRTWNALAVCYDAKESWPQSSAAFAHALRLAPDKATVMNNAGVSLLRQHRFDEAAALLREARRIAPHDERIANNLDVATAAAGQPITRRPGENAARWADRLNNAGVGAVLSGRQAQARAYLSQAISVDPTYDATAAETLARLGSGS